MVPARWGSCRLPGKPLANIGGLSLIEHVRRRVVATGLFERVIVATDDSRIAAEITRWCGEVVVTGPQPSGTHRVAEAASRLGPPPDLIVNVQGDQPLIGSDSLAPMLGRSLLGVDVITACAPYNGVPADPSLVKVWVSEEGLATDFSRQPRTNTSHRHHVGLYGFRPEALYRAAQAPISPRCRSEQLEQLAWMDHGMRIAVACVPGRPTAIDTAEQLHALRSRFASGELRVPSLRDP